MGDDLQVLCVIAALTMAVVANVIAIIRPSRPARDEPEPPTTFECSEPVALPGGVVTLRIDCGRGRRSMHVVGIDEASGTINIEIGDGAS